jgi:hypothetical protein
MDPGFDTTIDPMLRQLLATIPNFEGLIAGVNLYASEGITVGSTTALIPEASDAAVTGATVEDGMSGDTDFPHGNLKPIVTVGERSICKASYGQKITGVPDGCGAYLPNDSTVRVMAQSESYGPLQDELETYVR